MAYCRQCGAGLALVTIDGRRRERCSACGAIAFRNPAPVGLAVIEHHGALLLAKRSVDPLAGYWAPPGGYVECGESVPDAVIREAREETALDIALGDLIGVYSRADVDVVIVAYAARSRAGEPQAGDDAAAVGLFARGALPTQAPPTSGRPLDEWFHEVIRDVTAAWR